MRGAPMKAYLANPPGMVVDGPGANLPGKSRKLWVRACHRSLQLSSWVRVGRCALAQPTASLISRRVAPADRPGPRHQRPRLLGETSRIRSEEVDVAMGEGVG